jgi:TonB family protein
MLELSPKRTANPQAQNARGSQQSRRLLLALGLLLAALAAILIKDRQFWFGSEQATIDSDMPETATAQLATKSAAKGAPAVAARPVKKQAGTSTPAAPASEAPAVAMNRTVLPPLDIEVVAGNAHKKLHQGSKWTKLEIVTPAAAESMPATQAADREPIADAQPAYPLLAQHMNVQGSVVLQAVIGTDGVVENLRVLSGPAILASAAQQAVREWRFKPIVQNGQAVESKATITVNFTIKVADNAAKTTIAESQAAESLIITR